MLSVNMEKTHSEFETVFYFSVGLQDYLGFFFNETGLNLIVLRSGPYSRIYGSRLLFKKIWYSSIGNLI